MKSNFYSSSPPPPKTWRWSTGRWVLSALLTLFAFSGMQAQYLTEDFEGAFTGSPAAPSGWTQTITRYYDSGGSNEKDWIKSTYSGSWSPAPSGTAPVGAQSGSSALSINDFNFGGTSQPFTSRQMVSPVTDLSASTSPYLSFWYFNSQGAGLTANFKVLASNDGGSTYNTLTHVVNGFQQVSGTGWNLIRVEIPSAYRVSGFRFALDITNRYGSNDVWVDNVSVAEFTPGNITSNATGDWNNTATWVGGVIPGSGDNVTIASGHTVTICNATAVTDRAARCRNLTVTGTIAYNNSTSNHLHIFGDLSVSGTFNAFNSTSGRMIHVNGNVTINSGGVLTLNTGTNSAASSASATNFASGTAGLIFGGLNNKTFTNSGTLTGGVINNILNIGSGTVSFANAATVRYALGMHDGVLNASNLTLGVAASINTIERGFGSMSGTPTFAAVTTRNYSYLTLNWVRLRTGQTLNMGPEVEVLSSIPTVRAGSTFLMGTYNHLNLNGQDLNIGENTATAATLTLTRGLIITGANKVFYNTTSTTGPSAGSQPALSVTGILGSYVVGNFKMKFQSSGTTSRTAPIGLGSNHVNNQTTLTANRLTAVQLGRPSGAWAGQSPIISYAGAPSGTLNSPLNSFATGNRTIRVNLDGGADFDAVTTIALTGNNWTNGGGANSDGIFADLANIRIGQSPALSGPWDSRSAAGSAGAIVNNTNYTRTTATASPGPIGPLATLGEYFTWSTTDVICSGSASVTAATSTTGCYGYSSTLSLTGLTGGGLTYQWQVSPDNTTYTNISGAVSATYAVPALYASLWFRCVVTCSNGPSTSNSTPIQLQVTSGLPAVQTFPILQNFESWANNCGTTDSPGAGWAGAPSTGNNSWRRNDEGASASWGNITNGIYSPTFQSGAYSARFHSYQASGGTIGILDLHVDLSTVGTKEIRFWHINTASGDPLRVLLSTDGGLTFTQLGADINANATWTEIIRTTTSTASAAIVRLQATSDFASTDIGVDNFSLDLPPTCFPPTALAATPSTTTASISWVAPVSGTPASYEWEVRTSGSPGTGGAIASGSTTAPTVSASATGLTAATPYFLYVRTVCTGGDGNSTWAGPYSFSTTCPPSFSLPLVQGFNSASIPPCWTQQFVTGTDPVTFETSSTNATASPQEGSHFVKFNCFNLDLFEETRLVTPVINSVGTASVDVNFHWFHDSGYSTSFDDVLIQYSTDGVAWTSVGSSILRYDATLSGWTAYSVTLPPGAGNQSTLYVGFNFYSDYGNNTYLDNVSIAATPTCFPPTALTAVPTGGSAANISWTAPVSGSPASYNWEIRTSGVGGDPSPVTSGTTTAPTVTATATGLSPVTTYKLWVRTACSGGNGNSVWVSSGNFITPLACVAPTALSGTPTNGTTANIGWTGPVTGSPAAYGWEIRTSGVGGDPSPDAQGTVIAPAVSTTVSGLNPVTTYTLWVRTICSGGDGNSTWASSATFTTPQIPVSTYPYLEDAEANATQWGYGNGAQVNQWTVGTAASNGGTKGLYISNNAGTSNAYTIGTAAVVHLYRDFQMPAAGSIDLSFDWLGQGEATSDRLRVWLVPTSFTPTPGSQITSTGVAPTGRVQVGLTNYSAQGTFTTANVSIPVAYSSSLFRLVFEWRNDGSGGTQPPAAIDNIAVNYGTCFAPTAIVVSPGITTASVAYTASGLGDVVTNYQWEVRVAADNAAPGSGGALASGTSTSSPIAVTGLTASTTGYKFYIRTDCSGPGFSGWVGPLTFATGPCIPTYTNGKTDGDLLSVVKILDTTLDNNSGLVESGAPYTYFTGQPQYTASLLAGSVYTVEASIGTYGNQGIAAWVDYDDDGLFEASEKIGSTTGTIGNGDGDPGDELDPSHTVQFSINLSCTAPAGNHIMRVRDAFNNAGQTIDPCINYGYGETEDYLITLLPPPSCPQPYAGVTSAITATTATIGWTIGCTETAWDLHVTGVGGGAPGGPASHPGLTSLSGNVVIGLTPQTGYEFWIRAFCNPTYSAWTGPFLFNTLALPPANDDCAAATNLTVNANLACGVTTNGTTLAATASAETAPSCAATGTNDDVWYTFTATGTSHVIVITSATDMAFAVYSGACGSLVQVACSDPNSLTLTGLTASTVYHVRVWTATATTTTTATFTMCVGTPPPPPANDNCAGAVNLTVNGDLNCGSVTAGNTVSATASIETAPSCVATGTNDDVWFTFTATGSTHYVSLLNVSGSTDMAMSVYSGSCGSLAQVQCSDPNSMILTGLTASTVYHVRVWTASTSISTSASFDICVGSPPPPPANDDCAGAVALTMNADLLCGTTTAGTTVSATQSTETAPSCGATGTNDDVWYTFVATQSSHVLTLTVPSFTDMAMAVYSGSCGSLTQVACSDPNTVTVFGLTATQTYYVRVYTWSTSALTSATFTLCVGTPPPPPPPPANDECAAATIVTVNGGITCSSTAGGTLVGATPSTGPTPTTGTYDDDVWYRFTATSATHTIALTFLSGSTGDFAFQVLDDCGASEALINSDPQTATVTGLTPSNTYYIRVASWTSTSSQTSVFTVCVTTPPPPPANDDCSNAQTLTVSPSCGAGVSGTTLSATQDTDPTPSCTFGTTRDVWYKFNTGANIALNVNITLGTATSVGVQLYTACGSVSTSPVVCSTSAITAITGLSPSTQYYLRVFTGQFSTTGSFTICIAPPPPPPVNDNCAAATAFPTIPNTGVAASVVVNTLSATASPQSQCGFAFPDDDVWYTFTVPVGFTQINYSTTNISGSGDRYYELYTSCASASVVCFDAENGSITGLTAGATYTLRTFTYSTGLVSNFNLYLSVPPPPPANDNYCSATVLPVNAGCSYTLATTISATAQGGVATPSCGDLGLGYNKDVWFRVTVPTSGAIDINTQLLNGANSLQDGAMTVYTVTGTCPGVLNFTEIAGACDDDSGPGLLPSVSLTGRTFGETLYIRFWGYSATGNFGICVANGGTPAPVNDLPAGAQNVIVGGNSYPNCGLITGDVTAGGNSSESSIFSGNDLWYKFTAASTGVSITMTSAGLDNALVLYDNALVQMPGASSENAQGVGGSETLNYGDLVAGQQYYISAGNAFGAGGGTFQLCVRQLLASSAADGNTLTQDLCTNFKPFWRGATNYTFVFTGIGGGAPVGPTTVTSASQIPLSTAALALQYGGVYSVRVDANYESLTYGNNLLDSPITVEGTQLCTLTINPHAAMYTKTTQACPAATLLRGNILNGKPYICGATGFTVSFQKKASCAGIGDYIDAIPFEVSTSGASSNLPLGFNLPLPAAPGTKLSSSSWYEVKWRPEFTYGPGSFGAATVIYIGGSGLEENLDMDALVNGAVKADGSFVQASLYPNPNNGDMVNLNVAGVESDNVFVRIMDGMGRVVYTNRYTVDGSLSTVVTFAKPLAAGLYMVEFTVDGEIMTQRMMVQK